MTRQQFYRSKAWESLRATLMMERVNDNGELICERCGKPIVRKYDCIAHHKIELTEDNVNDADIALNPDNIELIHFGCHNEKHKRFGGFEQHVYLVYGAPCAGKTSWVMDQATEDDLILDIDRIWESLSVADRMHKPSRLKSNVFGVRDTILDQIRTRKGMWLNAYVIGTYPRQPERDRICDELRAEPIFIDTDKDICLLRAPSDEWRSFICEWFEAHT